MSVVYMHTHIRGGANQTPSSRIILLFGIWKLESGSSNIIWILFRTQFSGSVDSKFNNFSQLKAFLLPLKM